MRSSSCSPVTCRGPNAEPDVPAAEERTDDAIDWYLEVLETTPDRHYQARALLGLVQAGQTDRCEEALSYEEQGELLDVARIYCD